MSRLSNDRSCGFSDCAPCCRTSGDAPAVMDIDMDAHDVALDGTPVVDMEEVVKEIHASTNIPVTIIERVLEEENNVLYKMGIIYEL